MADPASGESGGTGTPQTSSSEGLYVDSEELTFPKEVGLPPPQDSDFQAPGTACPTGMSLFAGAWAAGQSPSVICTGPWGYATSVPLWGSGAKGISQTSRTGCDWASRVGRGRVSPREDWTWKAWGASHLVVLWSTVRLEAGRRQHSTGPGGEVSRSSECGPSRTLPRSSWLVPTCLLLL